MEIVCAISGVNILKDIWPPRLPGFTPYKFVTGVLATTTAIIATSSISTTHPDRVFTTEPCWDVFGARILKGVRSKKLRSLTALDPQRKMPYRKVMPLHTEFKSSLRKFHLNHHLEENDACVWKHDMTCRLGSTNM